MRILVMGLLAGFLAGFFLAYQPRHPVTILALSACHVQSGYLIVMSDGRLTRLNAQTLYYDDDASEMLSTLLDQYPTANVDIGNCA